MTESREAVTSVQDNPPQTAPSFDERQQMSRTRALFPEQWIINGEVRQTSTFVPVTCPCGTDALPALRYIGDETVPRELICERCGTHLAEIVHKGWEPYDD